MRCVLFCLLLNASLLHSPAAAFDDDALPEPVDLASITDRSDLQFEEAPAYYALLARARLADAKSLESEAARFREQRWKADPRFAQFPAERFPVFVDMIEHPAAYRGQPVSLNGHLIRLVAYPAGPNEFGIDTLYEGWLVTEDSQQHPATIVFTSLPPGMPIGEELINGVSVTGYFLKLHTYPSRDRKTRFAPLILAHTVTWRPVAPSTGLFSHPLVQYLIFGGGVLLLGAGLWLWGGRHRPRRRPEPPIFETDDPSEFLRSITP